MTASTRVVTAGTRATSALSAVAALGLSVLAALAVGGVLLVVAGTDPIEAYGGLWDGAFGDRYNLGETIARALPLAVVALGVAPALRAGVFTVGSEGQLAIGAAAAAGVVLTAPDAPGVVLIPIGIVGGAVGGALWALLPALLRAYLRVNEILSTLLMNYLAGALLLWLLSNPLAAADNPPTPRTDELPAAGQLGVALTGSRLHWGLLVPLAMVVALAWWVRSWRGLSFDVFGADRPLGVRLGATERRVVLSTMLTAGAAAGIAGWMQVAGLGGILYPSVAGGLGFTGVLVALLGDLRPLGIVVAAILFGALSTGADGLQFGTGVPGALATVIEAVLLIAATLAFAARQRRSRAALRAAAIAESEREERAMQPIVP